MALVESGTSPARISFTRQTMPYQTLQGGHYEKIRRLVNTRFAQSEHYCRSRFERFYRFEKLLKLITKKKMYDWKANVALPYAFAMAEQSAAIKWLALFMTRPFVTVQARKSGLDEIAIRRQSLLDFHLTGDIGAQNFGAAMLRKSERYGKSVGLVAPRWDAKLLKFRDRVELPTAYGPVARYAWKLRESRDYRIEAIDLDYSDFYPQPYRQRINGPKGMRWCMRTYHLTKDELLELEEGQIVGTAVGGQPVDDLKTSQEQDLNDYKLRRILLGTGEDAYSYRDEFDQITELIEYQGAVPREMLNPRVAEMEARLGLDPFNRLIILGNRHVVLEDIALPWDHGMKSYIDMDCVPDPHDFWGTGKVEPNEHLIYAAMEVQNSRLDNVKAAINSLIGVNGSRMPDGWKRRLVSQPFGVVETNGNPSEIIQRLQLGDVTASSYTEQQQLWTLIQEGAAINETMMGAPGPERTLGEHQLKTESASKRMQFELVGQADQLLGFPLGLAGFIFGLDRQYLPLPTYLRLIEPDTPDDFMEVPLRAEDLGVEDEKFLYLPTGATEGMNIQAKRADLGQMLLALQPFGPYLATMGFNFPELVKTILKIFGYDPSRYFIKVRGVQGPDTPGAFPALQAAAGMPGMPGGPGGGQRALPPAFAGNARSNVANSVGSLVGGGRRAA